MAIANIQDAQEVERNLQAILTAPDTNARIQAVRTLFVEILDYDYTLTSGCLWNRPATTNCLRKPALWPDATG